MVASPQHASKRFRVTNFHILGALLNGLGTVGASLYVYMVANLWMSAGRDGMGMADFTTEDESASIVSMAVTFSSSFDVLPSWRMLPMMEEGQRRSCLSLGFSLG